MSDELKRLHREHREKRLLQESYELQRLHREQRRLERKLLGWIVFTWLTAFAVGWSIGRLLSLL